MLAVLFVFTLSFLFLEYLQIELDTDRDNFMNPWEAKDYGLVDAVIDDGKPGLVAPNTDPVPPPKIRISDRWIIEKKRKKKLVENVQSEHKFLQNGYAGEQENNEAKDPGQEDDSPPSV